LRSGSQRGAIRVARADGNGCRSEYAARLHNARGYRAITALANRICGRGAGARTHAGAYEAAAERGDVTRPVAEAARAAATDRALALLAAEQNCAESASRLALASRATLGSPMNAPATIAVMTH